MIGMDVRQGKMRVLGSLQLFHVSQGQESMWSMCHKSSRAYFMCHKNRCGASVPFRFYSGMSTRCSRSILDRRRPGQRFRGGRNGFTAMKDGGSGQSAVFFSCKKGSREGMQWHHAVPFLLKDQHAMLAVYF